MDDFRLRKESPANWLIAAGLMLTLAGCNGGKSSEFHIYQELPKQGEKAAASDGKPGENPKPSTAEKTPAEKAATTDKPELVSVAKPQAPGSDPVTMPGAVSDKNSAGAGTRPETAVAVAPSTLSDMNGTAKPRIPLRVPVIALRPGEKSTVAKTSAEPAAARKVQLLVPTRDFKQEGPKGAIRVSYDDLDLLKVLNMEPVTTDAPQLMPAWLKGLDGKRIRIRGFMYPTFQATGLKGFVLARDNQICCFGRDPKIYDVFGVTLQQGVTADYIQNRPFDVVGVFHIRPEENDGSLFNLYEISDAIVIDK